MNYDYFYNQEAEQYIHYQMPKIMFLDERLNSLSLNAKFLYCLLLDRAKSSYQKGFIDKDGKVYVHFSQAELMKLIGCGRTKIFEYFNELDSEKGGVGLVKRKQKMGIGSSDVIYVKNFAKSIPNIIMSDTSSDLPYTYFCDDISSMRFKHYQLPKMLFLDEQLQNVSSIAKMIYSFMLDRIQLSLSNGWKDEQGRIYIIFPQKELQQLLGCSMRTVKSALKELDINGGVGLIDRTRQGMNNPDIIYLLDFTTTLKYKKAVSENGSMNIGGAKSEHQEVQNVNIGGAGPEHRKVQNLNIGGAEPEHREVQNLNIGSAKSEHREVQNLNIGGAKSEHHIYNNTDYNDTDINNTDFSNNLSICQSGEKTDFQQSDRQTDRQNNKKISFSEILRLMDLSYADFTFSENIEESALREKDFHDFCEEERFLDCCILPYDLAFNKTAMTEALKFVFAYSYHSQKMADESKRLLDSVIKSISEMVSQKTFTFTCQKQKQSVEYSEIIDRLNEIVHSSRTSLIDWFFSFEQEWKEILLGNNIKYQKAYMKTCIWNWLNDFLIVEDNQLMELDYYLKQFSDETSAETKSGSDCMCSDTEILPDYSENKEWEDYLKTADELEAEVCPRLEDLKNVRL